MVIGLSVKSIMTKPVVSIDRRKSVREVAKELTKKRVGSIIVTQRGKPVGIITETDLVKRVLALSKDPKKLKAKDVMSSPLVFAYPKENIFNAVEKMKRHKIKRIPVVEKGKIIGMVTNTDIARSSPELVDLLTERLKMRRTAPSIIETTTSGICEVCGNYSGDLEFINDQWVCEECREL